MNHSDLATRYADSQPGFRLAGHYPVGLPLWILSFDALVISKKQLTVFDEFTLRAIQQGIDSVSDISGFLGLTEKLVTRRVARLYAEGLLKISSGASTAFRLTQKGTRSLEQAAEIRPRRERIAILYDGITRQPITARIARNAIMKPADMRSAGLVEIDPLPTARPSDDELVNVDFTKAVPKDIRKKTSIHQVLTATRIGHAERRAREALMLVFRGISDESQVVVRFLSLDGRPMPEVDHAFVTNGGLKRMESKTAARRAEAKRELERDHGVKAVIQFAEKQEAQNGSARTVIEEARLRAALEEKQRVLEIQQREKESAERVESLQAEIKKLQELHAQREQELLKAIGRVLLPPEHAKIFDQAINSAKKHLLIVSPWIGDKVMMPKLPQFVRLARRKVEVYVGYGVTPRNEEERARLRRPPRFFSELQRLSQEFPNVHAKLLADTHAKVLICDDHTLVVTSHNWMSFTGVDSNDFGDILDREEIGYLVRDRTQIADMLRFYQARFRGENPGKVSSKTVLPECT